MDVSRFLDELGMSQYRQAFLDNAVDYTLLPELSDSDLRELGVQALGHRKRIRQAAAKIARDGAETEETESRAQRRQLTLMFADLVDSTRLSGKLELEPYNKIIRTYQDTARQVIEAQGGYVAKYIGDGVLAYFGYPKSHENDAERAIRAGTLLVKKVSELDAGVPEWQLTARVGIETGPVVVGEIIGTDSAQEHAVVGKTPNLAARLQALAEPGTVVVGPVSQRLARATATFQALGEHQLKGFDALVPVWRVDALSGTATRLDEGRTPEIAPLVGRRKELGALASAFARMRSGEALFVNVVGEPGIGKSRLVREFLEQNREMATILAGHCASHGGSTAFFPFINLLRSWFDDQYGADMTGVAWMDRLAESGLDSQRHVPYILKLLDISHPVVSEVLPDLIGVRTQEALARFIVQQGQVRPTILFINDLHWIDERSATLLDVLARNEGRQGVLILTTYRRRYKPPWIHISGVEDIDLSPLSAEESLSLFQNQVSDGFSGDKLESIVERAGGNPLFLEELARHVALAPGQTGEDWGATIPETLAGLLMQRVDSLSSSARRVAETAAVAGRRFDIALVGENIDSELAELEAGGVVLPVRGVANTYRFHHALVQDVVYESLLDADRRILHGAVGARLETQYAGREIEVAEDLTRHFEAASDDRRAARYAYLAGNKALDLFALNDAEFWYGKSLALVPSDSDPEDDFLFARAVVNQTQVLCWNGDFPAMVGLSQRHLPRIRTLGEIEEVSRALTWIGEGYMHVGRYGEARATLTQALESGRALGDDTCIGYALGEILWLDTIVTEGTEFDAIPDRAAQLEELASRVGDRYLSTLAFYVNWAHATQTGRIGAALEFARKMRAHGELSGYPPAECWGACLEAHGHAKAGNAFEADQAVLAGREAAACRFDNLMAELALGMTLVMTGRIDDGLAHLKEAPWRTDHVGSLYFAYAGDVAFGTALAAAGEVKKGLDWLRDGIGWFERTGNRRAQCMATLELARILVEEADDHGSRWDIRLRLRTLVKGATDPLEEARVCLDKVIGANQGLSMHEACVEALSLQALIAEKQNNLDAARSALSEAQVLAASLEWLPLEQRINRQARRLEASPSR